MIYELWRCEGTAIELAFFAIDENYKQNLETLDETRQLIWSLDADTYNEAMHKYYEYMAWELTNLWLSSVG